MIDITTSISINVKPLRRIVLGFPFRGIGAWLLADADSIHRTSWIEVKGLTNDAVTPLSRSRCVPSIEECQHRRMHERKFDELANVCNSKTAHSRILHFWRDTGSLAIFPRGCQRCT
jgi:hypothetical protein